MIAFICATCGVQHRPASEPPGRCAICEDERQYVGWDGQEWLTPADLRDRYSAEIRAEEPGLIGIGMSPCFAIGQRALLVRSAAGNILWDCIPLLDDVIIDAVRELGGIAAIAVSHPHFYSAVADWADAFDAPVLLHADDREWVMRPHPRLEFWAGEHIPLHDGMTVIRCGGHFDGAAVLHWPAGAEGRGALLVGDTIMVAQDRQHVSFMRSYPNLIPLPPSAVLRIAAALAPYRYDRIWSGWWSKRVERYAGEAVRRSVDRYLRVIGAQAAV
jgi:hypothetical protein